MEIPPPRPLPAIHFRGVCENLFTDVVVHPGTVLLHINNQQPRSTILEAGLYPHRMPSEGPEVVINYLRKTEGYNFAVDPNSQFFDHHGALKRAECKYTYGYRWSTSIVWVRHGSPNGVSWPPPSYQTSTYRISINLDHFFASIPSLL